MRLWNPKIRKKGDREVRLRPTGRDLYAVVEELAEDVVVVALTPWPRIDQEHGALRFDEASTVFRAFRTPARLQSFLGGAVEDAGQLRRPLRTGDVFLIRPSPGVTPKETAARLLKEPDSYAVRDVTAAARVAAKAAFYAAVTPVLDEKTMQNGRAGRPWPGAAKRRHEPTPETQGEGARSAGTVAYAAI